MIKCSIKLLRRDAWLKWKRASEVSHLGIIKFDARIHCGARLADTLVPDKSLGPSSTRNTPKAGQRPSRRGQGTVPLFASLTWAFPVAYLPTLSMYGGQL